jgi:hypothetical protein
MKLNIPSLLRNFCAFLWFLHLVINVLNKLGLTFFRISVTQKKKDSLLRLMIGHLNLKTQGDDENL